MSSLARLATVVFFVIVAGMLEACETGLVMLYEGVLALPPQYEPALEHRELVEALLLYSRTVDALGHPSEGLAGVDLGKVDTAVLGPGHDGAEHERLGLLPGQVKARSLVDGLVLL